MHTYSATEQISKQRQNGVAVHSAWVYPFSDWLREGLEKDLVCHWLHIRRHIDVTFADDAIARCAGSIISCRSSWELFQADDTSRKLLKLEQILCQVECDTGESGNVAEQCDMSETDSHTRRAVNKGGVNVGYNPSCGLGARSDHQRLAGICIIERHCVLNPPYSCHRIDSCFTAFDVGPLVFVRGSMNTEAYCNILDNEMVPTSWRFYGMDPCYFQDDNARRETAAVIPRIPAPRPPAKWRSCRVTSRDAVCQSVTAHVCLPACSPSNSGPFAVRCRDACPGLRTFRTANQRTDCSPPPKANRVQSPAVSLPDFRKWESYCIMQLIGRFSRVSPIFPDLAFQHCSILTSFNSHRLSRPRFYEPPRYLYSFLTNSYLTAVQCLRLCSNSHSHGWKTVPEPAAASRKTIKKKLITTSVDEEAELSESRRRTELQRSAPPFTNANWVLFPRGGHFRTLALGDYNGRCSCSARFLAGLPSPPTHPPPLRQTTANAFLRCAPYSFRLTLISSQGLTSLHLRGRCGLVVRLLTSYRNELGSIPAGDRSEIFAWGNSIRRGRCPAGFLGGLSFLPSLHSGGASHIRMEMHTAIWASMYFRDVQCYAVEDRISVVATAALQIPRNPFVDEAATPIGAMVVLQATNLECVTKEFWGGF
ncbi:hypothetical protein PR048_024507 [Dryococelus australis]|uniref:Uncharacterized protein n=1 Tax=Dryococelus australis TaxID=614101 RepID=A0ABQ9GNU0_9NEOP|nr:hypothetical protein PR048_024507 [Dryococelus australis]